MIGAAETPASDFDGDGRADILRPFADPDSAPGNAGLMHEIVLTTMPDTRLRVFLHPLAFTFVRSHRGDLSLITYHRLGADEGDLIFHAIDRAGVRPSGSLRIRPRDTDGDLYRRLFAPGVDP